jgi:hypothetical protein
MKFLMIFIIFLIVFIPQGFAESISNDIGSLYIEKSKYEISSDPDELIRIYGVIKSPIHDAKGHIQIQQPDGTLTGGIFETTDDGSFEYFLKLNNKSQVGDYVIFGTYSNSIIGKLTFSILPMSMESIKEIRERDGIEKAKVLAEEKAKVLAEEKAKVLAEEKAIAKAEAEEKAKVLAEEKAIAKAEAEEKAKVLAEEKAKVFAAIEKNRVLAEEKDMIEQNITSAINTVVKIVLLIIGIIIIGVIIKGKKMNQRHPDENYIVDRVKRNPYD